jgi:RNase P/RNase MRP subunit p29
MDKEKDWRIGLTVRPKYRNDPLYYEEGEIIDATKNTLKIKLRKGTVISRPSDDWVTM